MNGCDFGKKLFRGRIRVFWCHVSAVEDCSGCECACGVPEILKECAIANRGLSCKSISFFVYLAKKQLLNDVLCCATFHDDSSLAFDLYCHCAACLLLPCDIVELTPEVLLIFLLDNGADLVESLLILLLLGDLLPIFEMLPSESLSMLLIKYAFPLTCF
jgi:hypothetical protein